MALLSLNPRLIRTLLPVFAALLLLFFTFFTYTHSSKEDAVNLLKSLPIINYGDLTGDRRPPTTNPPPRYKPIPEWQPPLTADPFPLLATTTENPPPIAKYNVPRPKMHEEYNLTSPPPLFIGFTRQWPMLLQAVVSYITAGWPADNIIVVENTGVHHYNKEGKLSLQNPFYFNHTTLQRLGVQTVQTPVLLSFAQLQNFFLSIAYQQNHPYYFYSHQDVVVFSFEDGEDDLERPGTREFDFYDDDDRKALMNQPAANQPDYRTIYENCLRELKYVNDRRERWGFRWFQYDHLTLVNRAAMDAVGGWDSMIPYYGADCDIHVKLELDGWTSKSRRVGWINDVSSVMTDLAVFYRDTRAGRPKFADPNPMSPEEEEKAAKAKAEADAAKAKEKEEAEKAAAEGGKGDLKHERSKRGDPPPPPAEDNDQKMPSDSLEYFRILNTVGAQMSQHKYRDGANKLRNTWQISQRGGQGEPFHYDWEGFAIGFGILTDAGKKVMVEKWGHKGCDVVKETAVRIEDQWRVAHDWEAPEEKKEGR